MSDDATATHARCGENLPLTSLRGIAAIWVIFSHLALSFGDHWTGLSWRVARCGWIGVDVFFILSGFILALVYSRLRTAGIGDFLLRRLLRVYPLNIVTLLVWATLSATITPLGAWASWPLLPWYLLMVEAYLPTPPASWNPITWSVGIELLCYLGFPAAIMLLRRARTAPLIGLAVIAVAGIWWGQGIVLGWPLGWHAIMRGAIGFFPGMVLGLLATRLPRVPRRWATAGEAACLGAIAVAVAVDSLRSVPAIAAPLILLLASDTGRLARAMNAAPLVWLGRISFSVYILQGLVLTRLIQWADRLSWHVGWSAAIPLFILAYLAILVGLSSLTYVAIEQPGRRLFRRRRPRTTVSLAC